MPLHNQSPALTTDPKLDVKCVIHRALSFYRVGSIGS